MNWDYAAGFIDCRAARGKYKADYDEHCLEVVREMATLQMKGRRRRVFE